MPRSPLTSIPARQATLRACLLAAALIAGPAALPAAAELTLGPPDTRTTLDTPEGVVLADVDRDGFDDAVVGNRDDQAIQLFRGSASGFLAPTSHETGANLPVAVAVGDMNGDGNLDLVSAAAVGGDNCRVAVLLGDGSGGFAPAAGSPYPTTTNGPATGSALALADITGDGVLDVVTGGDDELAVLPGDGSGRLLAAAVDVLGFSTLRSLTVADVVGDGRPDVITGSGQPQTISELYVNRGGSVEFQSLVTDTGNVVLAGDLDGAGRADLVFSRLSGSNVGSFLSTGDGSFTAEPQVLSAGMTFVSGLALEDLDADGRLDLAVGGDEAVALLRGSGPAGAFAAFPDSPLAANGFSSNVALGDVTGDGQPDVVSTQSEVDLLTLVKNLNGATVGAPAAVDLGAVAPGGAAVEQTVTVRAAGPGFSRLGAAAVAGDGALTIAADGCAGRTLTVGAACELTVRFAPPAGSAAGPRAATVTVPDNSPAGSRAIALSGTVTAVAGPGGGGGGSGGAPGGGAGGGGSGGGGTPCAGTVGCGAPRDTTKPRLTRVAAAAGTPRRGRPASRRVRRGQAATVAFTLSEPARVRLTVQRRVKRGWRTVRTATVSGRAGANRVTVASRRQSRRAALGRWRVTLVATDAARNRSAAARAGFRVVRAR